MIDITVIHGNAFGEVCVYNDLLPASCNSFLKNKYVMSING